MECFPNFLRCQVLDGRDDHTHTQWSSDRLAGARVHHDPVLSGPASCGLPGGGAQSLGILPRVGQKP